jgi:type 1 glutamine amidotransferase
VKSILLISAGIFHPPWLARLRLQRLFTALPGYSIRTAGSFERLAGDATLQSTQAIVVYLHRQRISPAALAAFDRYVSAGGGVLAVHSATASFKQNPHYFEILGGRFTGHDAIRPFQIEPVDRAGPFAGLSPFTVNDELYLHELQPGVQVQLSAQNAGEAVPVVWTYRYGAGKVCTCSPGHRAATLSHLDYRRVLERGLEWVSG